MSYIVEWYRDVIDNKYDPRTQEWFLVPSPGPVLTIIATYIYFCVSAGPRYMKDKKPYDLKNTLIIYNFIQVLMANGVYLYFMCKLIELLDTVFFVLRKKDRQITFLHLYHHSMMPICAWIGVKFFAGGHPTFLGVINSFIHVFMYTYYMLAAFGPYMQKYLWWKKYLTILQIVQFIIIFFHNFQMQFTSCNFPKPLSFLLMINAGLFTYMFGSFYVNNYLNSKVGRVSKTNGAINGSVSVNDNTISNKMKHDKSN